MIMMVNHRPLISDQCVCVHGVQRSVVVVDRGYGIPCRYVMRAGIHTRIVIIIIYSMYLYCPRASCDYYFYRADYAGERVNSFLNTD